MDFSWAEPYPEVYTVCTLFGLHEISNPEKYSYTPLTAISQYGPQCGLVALAMVTNGTCNVSFIFELARTNNFTYHGEMFSACDMVKLAQEILSDQYTVKLYSGNLNDNHIKDFLLNGGLILVPYDKDKDNSPGLLKGHNAHWAILSGGIATKSDFYVLGRHGKAKNVAIWKLSNLAASNSQLVEFRPIYDGCEFKLPEGGIAGEFGLNAKAVLITKKIQ